MMKRKFTLITVLAASLLGGAALAQHVEKKVSASGGMMEGCRGMMSGGMMGGGGSSPNDQWDGSSR